jgi:hypothetical protein
LAQGEFATVNIIHEILSRAIGASVIWGVRVTHRSEPATLEMRREWALLVSLLELKPLRIPILRLFLELEYRKVCLLGNLKIPMTENVLRVNFQSIG